MGQSSRDYDPAIGAVRQVEYELNLAKIWNHQTDFLTIDSLEEVMGCLLYTSDAADEP